MATQLTKSIDEATDKVVSLVEQAQDAAIAVVAQVSETVAQYLPDLGPELGLGEVALHPEDAVESSFATGNKFVDAGRKAALGFVGAVAPVTDKIFGARAKKSPTKSV